MKKSIVCLTRGYSDYHLYHKLILRNKQIEKHLQDKEMDIVIFHEGNLPEGMELESLKNS